MKEGITNREAVCKYCGVTIEDIGGFCECSLPTDDSAYSLKGVVATELLSKWQHGADAL